jgi:hypothetical protein
MEPVAMQQSILTVRNEWRRFVNDPKAEWAVWVLGPFALVVFFIRWLRTRRA